MDAGPTLVEDPLEPPPGVSLIDRTVPTDFYEATRFLYEGANPIQSGVTSGTMNPLLVAVVRGRARDRAGEPLAGLTVTVLGHPEYGQTTTRADGGFDLAVNGGGPVVLRFQGTDLIGAQRKVRVPRNDYVRLHTIRLVTRDTESTAVDPQTATDTLVARSSVQQDSQGERSATLLFAPGTQATMSVPGGGDQPLSGGFTVRATEFTVGAQGPQAMPAGLPPTSAYTYAVELHLDEADAAGATQVSFDQPVVTYVENFLGFPVGSPVPVGYYDRELGQWVPSENGLVIAIAGISNGLAEVDIDGDGEADDESNLLAVGIDEPERRRLAELYSVGQSLWRVSLTHFTPVDFNWPASPPAGAEPPNQPAPTDGSVDDPCLEEGSIIACQNQVLGQVLPLTGTPYSLHYRSSRVLGRKAAYTKHITLSGGTLPAGLKAIALEIAVAGRQFEARYPAAPNQQTTFTWDGLDAYGRLLQGAQPLTVRIGYVYDASYQQPAGAGNAFGATSGVSMSDNPARQEVTLWQQYRDQIGPWDAQALGLGGWTLSVHHSYDPWGQILHRGDGGQRSAAWIPPAIQTVAGDGTPSYGGDGGPATTAQLYHPGGVAVGPDGSLYIADWGNRRIRRVDADTGVITTIAGTGDYCDLNVDPTCGDGGPAVNAQLSEPFGLAVGPDGSVYVSDTWDHLVRRINPAGVITRVVGTGFEGDGGDGGLATQAELASPESLAVSAGGVVYIADTFNDRIRRVGPDGVITTLAGDGGWEFGGDGGPAAEATLSRPRAVALGPDGSLYIGDSGHSRVRRVGLDGIIRTVAGNGGGGHSGDGGPAVDAEFTVDNAVAVDADGRIYIGDPWTYVIRRVEADGTIRTVVGQPDEECASYPDCGDGGAAAQALLGSSMYGLTVGPAGRLYVSDNGNMVVRRIAPAVAGVSMSDLLVPNASGTTLFRFDREGRHLSNLDTTVGSEILAFTYNADGFLTAVADRDGNVTSLQRDASGQATAVQGPYGASTTFTYDASGFLATVSAPSGDEEQFTYANGGLMASHTDPEGHRWAFEHDDMGRLVRDGDPAGGYQTLTRTNLVSGYEVTRTTALGRQTSYYEEPHPSGEHTRRVTYPNGTSTVIIRGADGTHQVEYPSGTTVAIESTPDPRWGMQSPLGHYSVTTPGGLVLERVDSQVITLVDPSDPLGVQEIVRTTEINGRLFAATYNASLRQWISSTPEGRTQTFTLDTTGRVRTSQVAGLHATEVIRYSSTEAHPGRLRELVVGGTRVTSVEYDSSGRLHRVTDPLSEVTQLDYDAAGRPTALHLPGGRDIQIGRDGNGHVTSISPPGRSAHLFTYDAAGHLASYIAPETSAGLGADTTSFQYNLDGQPERVTLPSGDAVSLQYDANSGRLDQVVLPRGTLSVAYDTAGRLNTITDPSGGALALSYDGHLQIGEVWTGTVQGSVSKLYDDDFAVSSRTVSAGGVDATVAASYDQDGRIITAGNLIVSRDPQHGGVVGTAVGSVTTSRAITAFGEVQEIGAQYGGADLFREQITARDDLGRIAARTEVIGGVSTDFDYTYDDARRLSEVWINGTLVSEYTYDLNGNRLSAPGVSDTQTEYDAQDRLITYGDKTFTFSRNGSLESIAGIAGTVLLEYDVFGNLMQVTLPAGTVIDYVVDGRNRRVGKRVDGALEQAFLYKDQLHPVAELDGNGNIVSRFIYATKFNVPDLMEKDGDAYRIISDHLGSVRVVVDANTGVIAQQITYDAFGRVQSDSNPGFQPFGFAGGVYDPDTGLIRFGARDYYPEIGRWTTKDPILFGGGSTNLFEYVHNDPINKVDPRGRDLGFGDSLAIHNEAMAEGGNPRGLERALSAGLMDLVLIPFAAGVELAAYFDIVDKSGPPLYKHCYISCLGAESSVSGAFIGGFCKEGIDYLGELATGGSFAEWQDIEANNTGIGFGLAGEDCMQACWDAYGY